VFHAAVPRTDHILESCFGDVLPYPYGPYREIEWIEVPSERAAGIAAALNRIAQFPLQETESGFAGLWI
jgi:hypothetical protein